MSIYHHDIQESMTMDFEQSIRIWDIPGFHVKVENLPKNATVQKTFVMQSSAGSWYAGFEWTVEGHTGTYMASIVKCSSLQELLDKIPEHFELEGSLDAFD